MRYSGEYDTATATKDEAGDTTLKRHSGDFFVRPPSPDYCPPSPTYCEPSPTYYLPSSTYCPPSSTDCPSIFSLPPFSSSPTSFPLTYSFPTNSPPTFSSPSYSSATSSPPPYSPPSPLLSSSPTLYSSTPLLSYKLVSEAQVMIKDIEELYIPVE